MAIGGFMIVKDKNGREIEVNGVYGSYADDIQIEEAYYIDTQEDVDDSLLDYIYNTYHSEIFEAWLDRQIGYAEAYCEGDR